MIYRKNKIVLGWDTQSVFVGSCLPLALWLYDRDARRVLSLTLNRNMGNSGSKPGGNVAKPISANTPATTANTAAPAAPVASATNTSATPTSAPTAVTTANTQGGSRKNRKNKKSTKKNKSNRHQKNHRK